MSAMTQRFSYSGPVTVDGVTFPRVILMEQSQEGGLRSWEGTSTFEVAPDGFQPNLGSSTLSALELPDGRTGQVLLDNVNFDGRSWTVHFLGTGPAPGVGS